MHLQGPAGGQTTLPFMDFSVAIRKRKGTRAVMYGRRGIGYERGGLGIKKSRVIHAVGMFFYENPDYFNLVVSTTYQPTPIARLQKRDSFKNIF
jgi:hypothetical protein